MSTTKEVVSDSVQETGSLSQTGPTAPSSRDEQKPNMEGLGEPVPHLHAKTFLTVFAVCFIYFAQLINVVGAGAQTQNIAAVLGQSENSVWLTSTIAIMTVVLSPIVSQAADYWGRRWLLVGLTACGIVGSIVVARATTMGMAIAGFTVTGCSYGAQPLLHAVASEVLPRRYRPWAQAADNLSAALGGLAALLAGGALTRNGNAAGIRNYWYMATAIYGVATVLVLALYNPPKTEKQTQFSTAEKLAKLDWVGYALLSSGLVLFCMGLSWSQNPYPWTDAHTFAPFVVGCVLCVSLAVYEVRFKKDGMFHHGLFRNGRNFPIALVCVFVEGLVFFAANNYFAFQVGVLYETDSLRTGLRYGVTMIVYGVAAVLAGLWCSTTRNVRWPTVVAFVSMIVFFVCMATTTPATSNPVWGYPVFLGIGLGICLCTLVTIAQLSTPPELIAITSGLMIGVRSLGGSIGLAVYNAIFSDQLSRMGDNIAAAVLPLGLPPASLPQFIGLLVAHDNAALAQVEGVDLDIIQAGAGALLETYSLGFRFVWVAAGSITVAAAIGAFFLVELEDEFNMHIDAPAENEDDLYSK
ncbi:PEP5 protein [Colletotrichum sojae]|uniref:PEP5 protein n=1 Tax=Colletotrichum sojae TaxID=2175907 RepID=A0A8H6JI08_9PEZI|nr:PEP5 protein [Colletotrichum sojae]